MNEWSSTVLERHVTHAMCPQSIHGETEKRQPQLQAVVELAEALKAVLRGHGSLVDDKVSLLRCNWIAVTSRAEEWLNLLLVRGTNRKTTKTHQC